MRVAASTKIITYKKAKHRRSLRHFERMAESRKTCGVGGPDNTKMKDENRTNVLETGQNKPKIKLIMLVAR